MATTLAKGKSVGFSAPNPSRHQPRTPPPHVTPLQRTARQTTVRHMRIALTSLLALAWLLTAAQQARAQRTREGALCTALVNKARKGRALTADEWHYLQAWCAIKNPYIWNASQSFR